MKTITLFLLLLIGLNSCKSSESNNPNFPIVGSWRLIKVESKSENSIAEGRSYYFSEENNIVFYERGLISKYGTFESPVKNQVILNFDSLKTTYSFQQIDEKNFSLTEKESQEVFLFEKEY